MKRLMPTNYFLILLILLVGFHFIAPVVNFTYSPYNYLGIVLIIFGCAINLWTDALIKSNNTTVKPHLMPSTLITSGSFSFSRHPMYIGMASILLGASVLAGSLITFIFPVLYIILMEILFIPMEEANLEKAFGSEYLEYKKKVRRWI